MTWLFVSVLIIVSFFGVLRLATHPQGYTDLVPCHDLNPF